MQNAVVFGIERHNLFFAIITFPIIDSVVMVIDGGQCPAVEFTTLRTS